MGQSTSVKWDDYPEAIKAIIALRKKNLSYRKIAIQINKKFNFSVNEHMIKRAYNKYNTKVDVSDVYDDISLEEIAENVNTDIEYKETHEILKDGSHKSDKLLVMTDEQKKDESYLLRAHGFDVDKWELVTARNNIWNAYSKQDGIMTMYASKITVKPRVHRFSYEEFVEEIKKSKPYTFKVKPFKVNEKRLLEIPLFDQHFGVSDYDYYKPTQEKLNYKINSRKWEQILFVIGSDLFHNDDFRGRTASGREIQEVDTALAWDHARTFYEPLIREAKKQAKHVKVIFAKGNHDESMSWAFVQMLKARFPDLEYDDAFIERKVHVFGKNFIGITHGDKAKKNLHNIFTTEFPVEWANCTTREIHTGHFHIEDAKDHFGTVVRTLATRNKTDKWHKDMGYVGGHKRFMIFEYSTNELESIQYV